MKIAIFGGSFNPIHNAHIKLVQRFVDEVGLDLVYFVPTNVTPLKDNDDIISSEHRRAMCELALRGYENFKLSDVELNRAGTSYSCDTISYFIEQFPDAQLYFIMGADMFLTLEKWKNFRYIFDNVTILTAPRDDCDYNVLVNKFNEYNKYNCKAYITKKHIQLLSSTSVRQMIANNIDVSEYLNRDVVDYILQNRLYR